MINANKLTQSLLVLSLITAFNAMANEQNTSNEPKALYQDMKLNQATLFLRGAELENSTTLNLPAGQSEIILSNIATNIDQKSLSLHLDNDDIIINSIKIKKIPIAPIYSSAVTALMNQQKEIDKQIEVLKIKIQVGNEQLALLKDQNFFGEQNSLSFEQSTQKLEFISQKMTAILNQQREAETEIAKLTEKYDELSRQIEIEAPVVTEEKTQIVISLSTPKTLTSKMQLSYITPDAGWSPTYDIRSQGMNKPITLTYKADVIQNTGINWDNVKLVLTSTNPSVNITSPMLNPWYLSLYNDNAKFRSVSAPAMISDESIESREKQMNKGITQFVTTNNNGINISHEIDLPYSFKNSTQPNSLVINQKEITAYYQYLATPKLAEEVYLQADVKEWENLNLLNGRANIYYMNNFVGSHFINTNKLKEQLQIPLGIDKNIQISRINNEKIRKEPIFIGSTIEQKESYTIKLRNMYNTPVTVKVYDQLPLSQENTISVTNAEYKEGVLDKETGKIEWNVTLQPKQEKSLPLNYTLSYPKNKQIVGL